MGGLGGRSVSSGVHAVPSSHRAPTTRLRRHSRSGPLGTHVGWRRGSVVREQSPGLCNPALLGPLLRLGPQASLQIPALSTRGLWPLGPFCRLSSPRNSAGPPFRSLPSASWRGSKGVTSQVTFPHPPALSFCPGLPRTDLSCTRRHSGGQGPSLRGPEAPGVPRKGWEERLTAGSVALPRV